MGAKILLDGRSAGTTPKELTVAAGKHQVRVKLLKYRTETRTVNASLEKTSIVDVTMERLDKKAILVATPSPATEVDGRRTPTWGYVALGVGLSAVASAAVLYGVGKAQGDSAHDNYRSATVPSEILGYWGDVEAAERKVTAGHVLIGVGAAAIAVWLYSYLLHGRRITTAVSGGRLVAIQAEF